MLRKRLANAAQTLLKRFEIALLSPRNRSQTLEDRFLIAVQSSANASKSLRNRRAIIR
jgi:hypothetical protein